MASLKYKSDTGDWKPVSCGCNKDEDYADINGQLESLTQQDYDKFFDGSSAGSSNPSFGGDLNWGNFF